MKKHIFTEPIIIATLDQWPEIHSIICNILDYIAFQVESTVYALDDTTDDIISISPFEIKRAVIESNKMLNIFDVQLKDLIRYVNKNKDLLSDATIAKAKSVQKEAELTRDEFDTIVGMFNMIYGDLAAEFSYLESEKTSGETSFS